MQFSNFVIKNSTSSGENYTNNILETAEHILIGQKSIFAL